MIGVKIDNGAYAPTPQHIADGLIGDNGLEGRNGQEPPRNAGNWVSPQTDARNTRLKLTPSR